MLKLVFSISLIFTVGWFLAIEGVGLIATLSIIGMPLLMPPRMPPELLVVVIILPFLRANGSLFSEPFLLAAEKPEPNSTPLTAGIAKRALASSPSSVSNIGSPRPAGRLRAIPSIMPPRLSPSFLASSMALAISSAASGSAQFNGFLPVFSLISSNFSGLAVIPPIWIV